MKRLITIALLFFSTQAAFAGSLDDITCDFFSNGQKIPMELKTSTSNKQSFSAEQSGQKATVFEGLAVDESRAVGGKNANSLTAVIGGANASIARPKKGGTKSYLQNGEFRIECLAK